MINVAFKADTAAHLRSRYIGELGGRFFWTEERMPASFQLDPAQLRDLSLLEQGLDRGTRSLARIESFLLILMTDFWQALPRSPTEAPDWLTRACEAIADPVALRQGVSALVGSDRPQPRACVAHIPAAVGQTPSAYVNALRMNVAARRLTDSDAPILDIALDCGVEDLSHFYRCSARRMASVRCATVAGPG